MKLLIRLLLISLITLSNSHAMEDAARIGLMEANKQALIQHNNIFAAFQNKNQGSVEKLINGVDDITAPIFYLDPKKPNELYKSQTLLELAHEFDMPETIFFLEQQILKNNLFLAFQAKNIKRVEELIQQLADIRQPIRYAGPNKALGLSRSETPLLELACEFKIPEAILRLRAVANERNISIDLPDEEGNTALARAIIKNSVDSKTVAALLTQDTINKQNKAGKTPLHLFLSPKKDHTAERLVIKPNILILLCQNGAQLDIQDDCGNTPIHYALALDPQGRLLSLIIEKSPFDIKPLINSQNKQRATPLHIALENFFNTKPLSPEEKTNCLNTIGHLCRMGACIDREDMLGNTPIHYALERDPQGGVLRIMLAYNTLEPDAFINVQNNDDATPLHIAIESYFNAQELNPNEEALCLQTIEELLELGARVTIRNAAKITPKKMIRATAALKDECARKLRAQKLDALLKKFATDKKETSPRTRAKRFTEMQAIEGQDDNSLLSYIVNIFTPDK